MECASQTPFRPRKPTVGAWATVLVAFFRAPAAALRFAASPLARERLTLALLLLGGLGLRLWLVNSPLGEVEADESVVGLMALHVQYGEAIAFYWGQPYLGSGEAYLVAAAALLVGLSNVTLKLVPGLAYLAFVLVTYRLARRDFGPAVALASVAYLALPPSFLLAWSVKARGGYVELLLLGQLLYLLAPWSAAPRPWQPARLALLGLASGLALWTHLLGLAFVLPLVVYLVWRLGRQRALASAVAWLGGGLLGLLPALLYNLGHEFETLHTLTSGGPTQQALEYNLTRFLEIGLPVLAGLGQATSSPPLFAADWPTRPASWPWVPPALLAVCIVACLPTLARVIQPARSGSWGDRPAPLLGLLLLAVAPLLASLGRFGELVAEPRYALPLYAGVPVLAAGWWWLARRRARLGLALGLAVLLLNAWSVLTADPRLALPTTAAGSTAANRAELLRHLEARGLGELYADYWLAYPLMFESRERVVVAVSSGGFDRYPPYPHYVAESERPGYLFVAGSEQRTDFERRLAALGGRAHLELVSIYALYSQVEPLDQLRP